MQNQNKDQQNQSNQSGGQKRSQSDLESIIRGGKFSSQSEANSYLQKHGLTCQMKSDGTAEIFDQNDASQRLATVQFNQPGQSDIKNISY